MMTEKETIEALQHDILGPRYKDKRVLMEFEAEYERKTSPKQVAWTCVLEMFPVWEEQND